MGIMTRSSLRLAAPVLAPVCASVLALSACGGGTSTTAGTSTTSAAAGASPSASAASSSAATGTATPTSAPADCPTEATRTFAKTRFVADVGLAAGTFHRWIYKPYQEGAFQQGAQGRRTAIAKAVAVAALDVKLISNAYENVKADPQLCQAIGGPLGRLKDQTTTMKDQITKGDLSSIAATEALVSAVLGSSQKAGLPIEETTDQSKAGVGG